MRALRFDGTSLLNCRVEAVEDGPGAVGHIPEREVERVGLARLVGQFQLVDDLAFAQGRLGGRGRGEEERDYYHTR